MSSTEVKTTIEAPKTESPKPVVVAPRVATPRNENELPDFKQDFIVDTFAKTFHLSRDEITCRINTESYGSTILNLKASVPEDSGFFGGHESQDFDIIIKHRPSDKDTIYTDSIIKIGRNERSSKDVPYRKSILSNRLSLERIFQNL